jgi:hypothetical protein
VSQISPLDMLVGASGAFLALQIKTQYPAIAIVLIFLAFLFSSDASA